MHIAAYLHERNEVKKQVNLFTLEKQFSLLGQVERGNWIHFTVSERERERKGAGVKESLKLHNPIQRSPETCSSFHIYVTLTLFMFVFGSTQKISCSTTSSIFHIRSIHYVDLILVCFSTTARRVHLSLSAQQKKFFSSAVHNFPIISLFGSSLHYKINILYVKVFCFEASAKDNFRRQE